MTTEKMPPRPIDPRITSLLLVLLCSLAVWGYAQLDEVPTWLQYLKTGFLVIMGIGVVGLLFLYGMAGLAMYKSAKEIKQRHQQQDEEA